MLTAQPPRYSMEETARHGQEIYLRDILPAFGDTHRGQYGVIDIETGAYEMDTDGLTATERLLTREPNAQMWLVRVGFAAYCHIRSPRRIVRDVAA